MKKIKILLLLTFFFTAITIFFACRKSIDPLALESNVPTQSQIISSVKELYNSGTFDKNLTVKLNDTSVIHWEPVWDNTTTKRAGDSTTYIYIKLNPRIKSADKNKNYNTPIKAAGFENFILVKQLKDKIEINLATFIREKTKSVDSSIKYSSSHNSDSFSGDLWLIGLTKNSFQRHRYNNGNADFSIDQRFSLQDDNRVNKHHRMANVTSAPCITLYICHWSATCPSGIEVTVTTGISCNFPGQAAHQMPGCSPPWILVHTEVYQECPPIDPPPPVPPDGGSWPTDLILNAPTGDPIKDIKTYLKCVSSNSPAVVTIYIDQPKANSSDSWSGNPIDPNVGHTFVGIKQGNITRLFGFYPSNGVNPFTQPSDQSTLVDDSKHGYDVSISISVSAAQMPGILNAITGYTSTYNLNSYNCTDFGMTISNAGGVPLPSSEGKWPGGGGDNPGALGENIRKMNLPGSASKNTSGGTAPENSGSCN